MIGPDPVLLEMNRRQLSVSDAEIADFLARGGGITRCPPPIIKLETSAAPTREG